MYLHLHLHPRVGSQKSKAQPTLHVRKTPRVTELLVLLNACPPTTKCLVDTMESSPSGLTRLAETERCLFQLQAKHCPKTWFEQYYSSP